MSSEHFGVRINCRGDFHFKVMRTKKTNAAAGRVKGPAWGCMQIQFCLDRVLVVCTAPHTGVSRASIIERQCPTKYREELEAACGRGALYDRSADVNTTPGETRDVSSLDLRCSP